MPFSQASITAGPTLSDADLELRVAWSSSSPAGTAFQVYLGRTLAWSGTATVAFLPRPPSQVEVAVGAVGPGEESTDFGASLPGPPGSARRPSLSWLGGRYLDDTLDHFAVYRSPSAGAAVDMASPVGVVNAAEQGIWHDGYGDGGYGDGGYGAAPQVYRWSSPDPLGPGDWWFAVVPVDAAGNQGPPVLSPVTVVAPPDPPAIGPDRARLRLAYNPTTRVATLSWLPPDP